ncbi:MAG: serine protease MucD, partial [Bdellovibrionales bacterium]
MLKRISAFALSVVTVIAIAQQVTSILPKLKEGAPLPHDLFVRMNKVINPAVVNISTTYLPKQRQMRLDPRFRNDP